MDRLRVVLGCCVLMTLFTGVVVLCMTSSNVVWISAPPVKRMSRKSSEAKEVPLQKGQNEDAIKALNHWYVDRALIASATSALGENGILLNNTLYTGRGNLSEVQTIWCGKRIFELRHAVSMLSVFYTLKPDIFHFYYDHFPESDEYNQWLQYTIVNYPFFRFTKCQKCCSKGKPKDGNIKKNDGIYVSSDIVISIYSSYFAQNNSKGLLTNPIPFHRGCYNVQSIDDEIDRTVPCFNLEKTKAFIATDTWMCTSGLCDSIRYYMYQKAAPVQNVKHESPVVPNIAHYVNYNQEKMDFNFYMSVLSLIYIGNLSHVYIHSNRRIGGEHWDNLMKQSLAKEKVHLVQRTNAKLVYGQDVGNIQHCADTGKVDVLYKYGGVVVDPDLMMIRQLDPDFFHYDAVLSYDTCMTKPFPDRLNLGISMARPQSVIARIWRESMRNYFDKKWLWNSGEIPYKVVEYNPYLANVSKSLQVMVASHKYRPPWLRQQGYKYNIKTLEEWQELAYSFHYVHPNPFKDLPSVWTQKGMTGDVGRFILKCAGIEQKGNSKNE